MFTERLVKARAETYHSHQLVLAYRVVYGDLGTSPLYTFAGIFSDPKLEATPENFIGARPAATALPVTSHCPALRPRPCAVGMMGSCDRS